VEEVHRISPPDQSRKVHGDCNKQPIWLIIITIIIVVIIVSQSDHDHNHARHCETSALTNDVCANPRAFSTSTPIQVVK